MPALAALTPAEQEQQRYLLQQLVTNKSPYDRAKAARELGLLMDSKALTRLHDSLLNDTSTQVRISAANAIARINNKASVKRLLAALTVNRGRTDVQLAIIRALGDMKENSREQVPVIVRFLRSPNPLVREATIDALWKIRDYSVSKYLVRLLKVESETTVKLTLVRIIPDFKDPNAIPVLLEVLKRKEENADVKALAEDALVKFEQMGITAPPLAAK